MTARTQVLSAIEHLGPRELLKVADFIETLQSSESVKITTTSGIDYKAVRKASLGLGISMSEEINRGREDRI